MAHKYIHVSSTDSTNAYLQARLAQGESLDGTVVSTDFQRHGKGMDQNIWDSDPKRNLLFSMAIDMSFMKAKDQILLSQAVPLGIVHVLDKYLSSDLLRIKWPNDIYYTNKKLGGILINSTINGAMMGTSIIGIGLNVNQDIFPTYLPNPISLKVITHSDFILDNLLTDIVPSIDKSVDLLKEPYGADIIRKQYLDRVYLYNKFADYEIEGKLLSLKIVGINEFGHLQLVDSKGKKYSCDIKEIKFMHKLKI
jgi:birA, biotin-[acetyl-CoA-carboxylase] ligase region